MEESGEAAVACSEGKTLSAEEGIQLAKPSNEKFYKDPDSTNQRIWHATS